MTEKRVAYDTSNEPQYLYYQSQGRHLIAENTTSPSYFGFLIDNTEGRHFTLKDDGVVVIEPLTAKRLGQLGRGMVTWDEITRQQFRNLMSRFVWDYREGRQ